MKHQELGEKRGSMLLFGGIYSNRAALQAVFDVAKSNNIPIENLISTGDIVAYCADVAAVMDEMIAQSVSSIAGNCEKQLAADASNCGCGFDEGSQCDILSKGWYPHALRSVTQSHKDYMATLPDIISFTHDAKRYAVIHGGFHDISRFIWSNSPDAVFKSEIDTIETAIGPIDTVIAGHSGIPFIKTIANKTWINAGAVGMPPNDGNATTRYVLLGASAEIHRLTYPWIEAQSAMLKVGLDQGYERALETGYWPSQDILPPELRVSR